MSAKKQSKKVDKRDNFSRATKEALAKRAGYRCSIPGCKRLTVGPAAEKKRAYVSGVAAHIVSASKEKGPRADPSATSEFRKSIENGIWCCGTHGTQIDSDHTRYSVELLRKWRQNHEDSISMEESGCFVGKGIVTAVTAHNLGRFDAPQSIRFGAKTLLLGGNKTGKHLLCDMVSSLSNFSHAERWKDRRYKQGASSVRIEAFSGMRMTWKIHFGDRVICNANGEPVPTIYSGFRVLNLDKEIRLTGPSRSDFGKGNLEDKDEDAAWEKVANSTFLDDMARMFDLPRDGLLTALKIMENTPGKFFTEVKIDGEALVWRINGRGEYWSFGQLSEAEGQFVILDIFLRLAEYSANFSPTILILNQHSFGSMDSENLPRILKTLGELELQCQLIVPLYIWPDELPHDSWHVWHLHSESDRSPVTIHEGMPAKRMAKVPPKSAPVPVKSPKL